MKPHSQQFLTELVQRYPILREVQNRIADAVMSIRDVFIAGGTLFLCGNGGSAADAEHIAGELLKGFLETRRIPDAQRETFVQRCGHKDGAYLARHLQMGLRAIALTGHPAMATAMINDLDGELVFAQQLFALARPGDALLGISTSGNARNVELAALTGKACGVKIIALTGRDGGRLKKIADIAICVPADTVHETQELHLPVYHTVCAMLESDLFSRDEDAPVMADGT